MQSLQVYLPCKCKQRGEEGGGNKTKKILYENFQENSLERITGNKDFLGEKKGGKKIWKRFARIRDKSGKAIERFTRECKLF